MKQAQVSVSRLTLDLRDHVDVEFIDDQARACITILARTRPARMRHVLLDTELRRVPAPWHHRPWARFVRWATGIRFLGLLVPAALAELAYADVLESYPVSRELPWPVFDSIQAQLAEFISRTGRKPTLIVVGFAASSGLRVTQFFSSSYTGTEVMRDAIMGYPLVACSRLEQDAVLVI